MFARAAKMTARRASASAHMPRWFERRPRPRQAAKEAMRCARRTHLSYLCLMRFRGFHGDVDFRRKTPIVRYATTFARSAYAQR